MVPLTEQNQNYKFGALTIIKCITNAKTKDRLLY